MGLEVIGAGFGRTGTLSLKLALEQLGFAQCYHMFEVMNHPEHVPLWRAAHRGEPTDWEALFAGYRAAVDWPSCNFWREQMAAFPDAKVVLSLRDPERWYTSVMNTIYPISLQFREQGGDQSKMVFELIWDGIFAGRMDDKAFVIEQYLAHNQRVRETVPSERLLEFDPADGWQPLCAFLERPVPDEPYPRANTTEEFQQRLTQALPPKS